MGGCYKSYFGTSWNDGPKTMHRYNVKNGANNGAHLLFNPENKVKEEVVCLDGAFLSCKKKTWQLHKFDEQQFKGFHFYDLDFSLQVYKSALKNYVIYNILIEHFSTGNMDTHFLNDYLLFAEKWKAMLPMFIGTLSGKEVANYEGYALTRTMQLMKKQIFCKACT